MDDKYENYRKLAARYGPTASGAGFLQMCEEMMTPEECGLVLELLDEPMTPAELAKKLNRDEKSLAETLDSLARRAMLFRGKTQYIAWQDSHQFGARINHNAEEYIPNGWYDRRRQAHLQQKEEHTETFQRVQMFKKVGVPIHRVIPARLAIAASPKIKPDDVLWYEDTAEIIRRNNGAGVVDCPCRRINQNCDRPLWVCLHFGWNIIEYEVGRGGRMKELNVAEAIEASDLAETSGLVHLTPANNASIPGVICNCCPCCCGVLGGAIRADAVLAEYSPSRYQAIVEQEVCTGCQTCIERCPFDAIEMVKQEGSKKLKARVIKEKCMGCGVCVITCEPKALTFELVRPAEHIPPKTSRMSAGKSFAEVK
jgi:ferredoxin